MTHRELSVWALNRRVDAYKGIFTGEEVKAMQTLGALKWLQDRTGTLDADLATHDARILLRKEFEHLNAIKGVYKEAAKNEYP